MMVAGTKRWTVAPPSEARLLQPKCTGGLCWVKSLEHPDEHAKQVVVTPPSASIYLLPLSLSFSSDAACAKEVRARSLNLARLHHMR